MRSDALAIHASEEAVPRFKNGCDAVILAEIDCARSDLGK
jgi:hypothetical protein